MKEIILAAAGATGFGLLFGIRGKKIWFITLNSAFAWYVYLLIGKYSGNLILAMFIVTVLVGMVSGIIALFIKCPLMVFIIPILIPFIPGATLYYVMYDIVNQLPELNERFTLLLSQVGAIALGILVAEIGLTVVKKMMILFADGGLQKIYKSFTRTR